MPSFKLEENLVIITYTKGGILMLQRDHIVGLHLKPDPDTLDIVLKKNTVSLVLGTDGSEESINGWSEVIRGLKDLVTVVTRARS